jgi:DNA-binding MarR family transcriptional regulator
MSYKKRMLVVSREFGLTLQQAAALRNLDPSKGMPMNALADALSCDAANVTAVVDKLEARGLVRRAASPDRRVRLLETTPAGVALRERILARMREPTPWITALEPDDQRLLRDLLRKGVSRAESSGLES